MAEGGFELIFEGPSDSTPDTLRKVKSALVGELQIPVGRVKEIMENAPSLLTWSESEEDLQAQIQILKKAGAKVLLVRKAASEQSNEESADPQESGQEEEGFTFDFDLNDNSSSKQEKQDEEIAAIEQELAADPHVGSEVDELLNQLSSTELLAPIREKIEIPYVPPPKKAEAPPPPPVEPNEEITQEAISRELASLDEAEEKPVQSDMPEFCEYTPPPLVTENLAGHVDLNVTAAVDSNMQVEASAAPIESVDSKPVDETPVVIIDTKRRIPIEVSVGLLVTLVLLAVVQSYFYSGPRRPGIDMSTVEAAFQRLANAGDPDDKPKVIEKTIIYQGEATAEGIHVTSRFDLQGTTFANLRIEVNTPNPPELTPEQIVHHEDGLAWIYKIEADEWRVSKLVNNQFVASTQARTFVEFKAIRWRLISNAHLRGTFDPQTQTIKATLEIKANVENEEQPQGIVVEPLEGGRFKLYLKRDLEAHGAS